jgi:hypothetical protein
MFSASGKIIGRAPRPAVSRFEISFIGTPVVQNTGPVLPWPKMQPPNSF